MKLPNVLNALIALNALHMLKDVSSACRASFSSPHLSRNKGSSVLVEFFDASVFEAGSGEGGVAAPRGGGVTEEAMQLIDVAVDAELIRHLAPSSSSSSQRERERRKTR